MLTLELLALAALWGWWAWRDPKRAFIGLPILLPAYVVRTKIGPFPTTALELVLVATVIAWLLRRRWTGVRETWNALRPWQGPALLWLAAGLIAVFVGATPRLSREAGSPLPALGLFRAYFIEPLLVFFMGADLLRSHEDKQRLARSFAVITIILGAWAGIQMLTGWGIPHPWDAWPGRRATGPFPFPNALALFVTPIAALAFADRVARYSDRGAPLGFARGRLAPLPGPVWGWLTVVAGLAAIVLARSDGGLVAFVVAAFAALIMHRRTRKAAVALGFALLLAAAIIGPVRSSIEDKIFFREWSGKVRTVMWQETWTMLTDTTTPIGVARPILGTGLAAYPAVILPYHKATWMEVFQYPHNILLNLWSETGLLGVVVFGWMLFRWCTGDAPRLRSGQAQRRPSVQRQTFVLALPVIVALLVHGLVDVPYFKNDLAVAFWLLILVTTSLHAYDA